MSINLQVPQGEAEAYITAIITSSDDAIISKDLNGNITSWNPSAERIFGFTAEEAVGKHISIIIPPEKLSEEDYILGEVRAGRRVVHFETARRHKSGKMIDISVTVSPIRNKEGKLIGASKIARDITDVRQAERASAYLGAIIESSDDAIISKDLNGFITSWNKSAERIFGYTEAEVVGRHITILIPAERLPEEDKILTTLRTGNRVDHFETWRRHKDGHLVPVSLTVSPIRNGAGTIVGASKVSRDISDRIAAENALRDSSRKKDEFLANMSHELRTPMNAVIGLSSLLKVMDGLPDKARKYVETLATSADALMALINDLLDFAKIEAESFEIEKVEFNLARQVEGVISITNVKAQEKNLQLYLSYSPDLARNFIGDPLRLGQVLNNLVSNAIKFTDRGSIEIDIKGQLDAENNQTWVTFKVSDTGIGIPASKIDTIFQKFTQADASITRRFGGTGLGLAICRACVDKMGGTIEVVSEVGIGSTFTVRLPFENSATIAGTDNFTASSRAPAAPRSKDVLLVEDYEPNVLVATEMLEGLGYSFDVARNGFDAVRKFSAGSYKAILMDVQMHEMDGLEATRRIRRVESEREIPRTAIIAMTAHVRDQDKDKCLEAGMDDFIPKPFLPKQLAETVRRYIADDSKGVKLEIVSGGKKE
ncbi:MAG: PAS domain S-box protein [bacterium]|nr:PAS domain S-box protein [bacterium]